MATSIEPGRRRGVDIALAISWILILIGGFTLAYAVYIVASAIAYQRIESRTFERTSTPFSSSNSRLPQPGRRRRLGAGEVVGEIQIPRLGLKAIVVEGDTPRILRRAVGHIPNTAFPGESGNVALAGHRDSFFRQLRGIERGDVITFDATGRLFRYQVQSTEIVSPKEIDTLRPTTARELTLITCFPFGYIGPAPARFVVHAPEIQAVTLRPPDNAP